MTQLIAVVATAVIVNGERVVIQPGHPLPELNEHDTEALKKSQAAFDPALSAEARAAAEAAALAAAASFQSERGRVQAQMASTELPDTGTTEGAADGSTDGTGSGSTEGASTGSADGIDKSAGQAKATIAGSAKPAKSR